MLIIQDMRGVALEEPGKNVSIALRKLDSFK